MSAPDHVLTLEGEARRINRLWDAQPAAVRSDADTRPNGVPRDICTLDHLYRRGNVWMLWRHSEAREVIVRDANMDTVLP